VTSSDPHQELAAWATELLHTYPVAYVQFGLVPSHCTLVLENRTRLDLETPPGLGLVLAEEQIDFVEETRGDFFIWVRGRRSPCRVLSIYRQN
jgi:hypothetical protein